MDADGAFRRLAGQAAGVLFVVGGLMCVADAPAAARGPGAFVAFVAMGGLAVAAGAVLLRLPWQRWPRRATLWIVPPALLVSGLSDYLDPSPYTAALPFFLLALWLGISQPRGTALALSPATALAYWAPIALAPHAPGLVASVPFVTVTCALVGETLAWLTTRLGEAQQRLRDYEAFHDRLTGLPNRASFGDQLRRARARSQRLAVLFCGLDGFKSVNDRLGHAAGDAVLVEVARRLTQAARPVDLAARLGGDEFAVLVEDWGDEPELLAMAEHLRRSLVTPVRLGERQALVGMSVGIAAGPASGSTDLLADAGLAMVEAKRDKGGGVAVYHPRIRRGLVARTELLADLEHAVERGELRVHYQPIVDLGDGHVLGVEALVRWAHPRRGLLGPDQFIAAAEQSGLITSIGRWVLEQACLQVRGWQRRLPELAELQLSVNLSPLQLASDAVVGEVAAALDNSGLRPGLLVLEVTERLLLDPGRETAERLDALKALGVRLAIDDFGAGSSSLHYLRDHPFDVLKVDKSFIDRIDASDTATELVRSIGEIGRTLGVEVVAEGIEHPYQAEAIRAMGYTRAQGFLFSRPLAAADLLAFLSGHPGKPPRTEADDRVLGQARSNTGLSA